MTDTIIDRATRALAKSQCGVDDLEGLDEEMQAKLREDALATLAPVVASIEAWRDEWAAKMGYEDYTNAARLILRDLRA